MQKAFVKKNPPWVNYPDISTPIIADELNRVETGIDTIDDRVVAMDSSKANQNDLNVTFKNVSFDSTTGTFTFTKWNDTTVVIDTDIEKIAVDMDYDDDPTSAHYQQIVLTLSDGTVKYIDVSALITQYEFEDTATIAFSVSNSGVISANIVDGSITGAKLQPNYLADITTQANSAYESSTASGNYKLDSEAWANGTRNGQDVPSTDPAYHNNAKYWKDQAQHIAAGDLAGLTDVDLNNPTDGQVLTYNFSTQHWINADSAKGMVPHIIINSEASATVTLSKGGTTITATETSSGVYECDVEEYGTYTITLSSGGQSATKTLDIDTVKVYETSIYTFAATITVTYPSGGTCTCNGTTVTTTPYTFTVTEAGTYPISVFYHGTSYSSSATITSDGQSESILCPTGAEMTPANTVSYWLFCGGRTEEYTTLTEILADQECLAALMINQNACDYLVRSTGWVGTVCASENGMNAIGSSDYACELLLADSSWLNSIVKSDYAKNVLNVFVPTMTSNTAPTGECIISSQYSTLPAWQAFDGDDTTRGAYTGALNGYLGYVFPSAKKITSALIYPQGNFTGETMYIQTSSDGTNWTNISSALTELSSSEHAIPLTNTATNRYYRITNTTRTLSVSAYAIYTMQFFGREKGGVQDWLQAGGITDKDYITVAEVLADSTTLLALISSHNAMDYLVTATGLADEITADSTAMSYIGADNYASDTLLADSTWLNAICNSTYFESVLNVKVPTMTSNTTPSGLCGGSTIYDSGFDYYRAFNGNNSSNGWKPSASDSVGTAKVYYRFTEQIKIHSASIYGYRSGGAQACVYKVKILGSNDGTNWTAISNVVAVESWNVLYKTSFDSISKYQYCAFCIDTGSTSGISGGTGWHLQFYGRADV